MRTSAVLAIIITVIYASPRRVFSEKAFEGLQVQAGRLGIDAQTIPVGTVVAGAQVSGLNKEARVKTIKDAAARANGSCSQHWQCLNELPPAVKLVKFAQIAAHAVTWYRQMALGRQPAYPVGKDRYYPIAAVTDDLHAALDYGSKQPIGYRLRYRLNTWGGPSMFSLRYYADFYYRNDGDFLGIEVSGYSSPTIRSFPIEALPHELAEELKGPSDL